MFFDGTNFILGYVCVLNLLIYLCVFGRVVSFKHLIMGVAFGQFLCRVNNHLHLRNKDQYVWLYTCT